MTQPIPSDRPANPIADRDRPTTARSTATPAAGAAGSPDATPAPDTADVSRGSALLRSAAPGPGSGAVGDAAQARALAGRITESLQGDPARAMQAYAAVRRDDVEALLVATA